MTAQILDGKQVAQEIQKKILDEVTNRKKAKQRIPGLAVVIVGEDPASKIYVNNKRIACDKVGFYSLCHNLPVNTTQEELEELIDSLNQNPQIDGIIVQMPLPAHLNANKIFAKIVYTKDVDGFHPYNIGCLALRQPFLRPCTPFGIITLLQHYHIPLVGLNAVIVGASNIVGRPMALEFLLQKMTVTVCHRYTQNLASHIKTADIIVVAIGKRGIIKSEWLKNDAIIIDVGINRLEGKRITGDIDFDTAIEKASWITPVPGGVGPMTVTMLLQNTLIAAKSVSFPS